MASLATNPTSRTYSISTFTTSNYATWSIKIEMLLIQSKIWSVVDGKEIAPHSSDVVGLIAWQLKDAIACADILHYCGDKQFILLRPLKTSKEVWDCIKQIYEKSNRASQVNLYKRLYRMTIAETEDVI